MKIKILTIYYALRVALLVASIHEVSANKHFEVDDSKIDIDQEVGNVSCYLLVDTTMRRVYHSFQNHMLTSFGFRRLSLLSNILYLGMISSPPPQGREEDWSQRSQGSQGKKKQKEANLKLIGATRRKSGGVRRRRMQWLFRQILLYGLPPTSTAVISLNFASLIQHQSTLVWPLTSLI
jgi:hypothetical protein